MLVFLDPLSSRTSSSPPVSRKRAGRCTTVLTSYVTQLYDFQEQADFQLVSVSGFGSILYPLWAPGGFDDPRRSYLPDRTYLGGPNSVRGWKVGGLGLSDKCECCS